MTEAQIQLQKALTTTFLANLVFLNDTFKYSDALEDFLDTKNKKITKQIFYINLNHIGEKINE